MKATYTFAVITQPAGVTGRMQMESLFTTRDEKAVAELRKFLLEQEAGFRRVAKGANSRPVRVVHVDAKEHERWCREGGRNGPRSKPVEVGQTFRSAVDASGWVGLRHNEVAMALSRAKATGENRITVRGVTFAYAD